MKTNKFIKVIVFIFISAFACSLQDRQVVAEGKDGHKALFKIFFGSEESRAKQRKCSHDADSDGQDATKQEESGMLGMVNNVFCKLEKKFGITGTGNATKTFGSTTAKCSVTDNAAGSTYERNASCWICREASGTTCSSASSFKRLLNLQWSFADGDSKNKGELFIDHLAFGGLAGQTGIHLTYDIGTSGTKTLLAKMVFPLMNMRADASKSDTTTKITVLMGNSLGAKSRYNATINTSTKTTLNNYETASGPAACTNGHILVSAVAKSDTPSCTKCYVGSKDGTDLSFTASTGTECSAFSLLAYPAESVNDVVAYTVTDTASSIMKDSSGAFWGGMGANPSF